MPHVTLPDGTSWPALGLGTWRFGESKSREAAEVAAIRLAIELGVRLFDTAEMYGEGGAESVLGRAIAEAVRAGDVRRDELIVVSKVYPHNASRSGTAAACDRSRKRLGLDRLDLYLLHWRGQHPLAETVAGFEALMARGQIARWGVSNLDLPDMQELTERARGSACAANQCYYSLSERGIEFSLLPWMRERRMPMMAYCPLDQGHLAADPTLGAIGAARGATASQVALAWVLAQPGVIAIPKAGREAHLRENVAAAALTLSPAECAQIDAVYPPPRRKQPLAMS
jgi:diketogulonate reductase-like aldo/keto reductase